MVNLRNYVIPKHRGTGPLPLRTGHDHEKRYQEHHDDGKGRAQGARDAAAIVLSANRSAFEARDRLQGDHHDPADHQQGDHHRQGIRNEEIPECEGDRDEERQGALARTYQHPEDERDQAGQEDHHGHRRHEVRAQVKRERQDVGGGITVPCDDGQVDEVRQKADNARGAYHQGECHEDDACVERALPCLRPAMEQGKSRARNAAYHADEDVQREAERKRRERQREPGAHEEGRHQKQRRCRHGRTLLARPSLP